MRNLLILTLVILISPISIAKKAYDTGDKQLDRWLININYVARNDWMEAIKGQAQKFKVKEEILFETYDRYEYSPADFYVALSIQKVTGAKWDAIIDIFQQYRTSGIAKVLEVSGLPDHSKEYQAFKQLIKEGAPERDLEAEKDNIFLNKKDRQ